jgi:signal transduction histidine kinase
VWISVSDQGWGIVEADLERIFEKYRRGNPDGNRRPSGLGVGLYISQRIIEAHGSQIEVESEPGQGTSFRFALQAAS